MGFFKKITRPIRKIAKKIIPKEIKPFLPYIAAFYGGPAMAGSNFMRSGIGNQFLRNAVSKGLIAGATAGSTDEDANILRTATLAAAPDLISGGLGKIAPSFASQGKNSTIFKGITGTKKAIDKAGLLKTVGAQGAIDASAKLAELNQEEIDKYNDSLGGNLDRGERRAQLTAIFSRAGYEPEYIDTMLTTYGYAQGGIASLRSGYEEGGTVTISKKEYERLKGDKEIAQGIDFASTGLGMLGKSGHSMEPVGMLKFARGGEVIEEQEDLSIEGQTAGLLRNMIREHGYEGATTMWNSYKDMMRQGEINMGFEEFINQHGDMFGGAQGGLAMARGGEVIEESETLMAGGPYGSGRDTQDAMNVWQGMGPEDKSLFEGFIDFYKNGSWRDQIMGQADIEENTMMASAPSLEDSLNEKSLMMFRKPYYELTEEEVELLNEMATGGRVGYAGGGIMDRNLLNTGMDKDMRGGGFIPEGTKEKADDVPARLSKNEFVMTADAVKAAGGGSVNKGAQRMYNIMNQLEAKA
jgi:hypothetical protein